MLRCMWAQLRQWCPARGLVAQHVTNLTGSRATLCSAFALLAWQDRKGGVYHRISIHWSIAQLLPM
eukprot:15466758-Alexandrium_andersonii.AAC.1